MNPIKVLFNGKDVTHLQNLVDIEPEDYRIEQGRTAWLWIHTEALARRLTLDRLANEFEPMIPRFGCSCLDGWKAILVKIPFRPDDQFAWGVDVHNAVNAKRAADGDTTKRQWSYDEARAIYNDASNASATTAPPQ